MKIINLNTCLETQNRQNMFRDFCCDVATNKQILWKFKDSVNLFGSIKVFKPVRISAVEKVSYSFAKIILIKGSLLNSS